MFLSLIERRRSIRRFEERRIEKEKIDLLAEAALRSPSSRGFNPWQFIIVTDKGLLQRLSEAKQHGSAFLKNAPLGIVVCADPSKSDVWVEDASIACLIIHLAAASLDLGSCWVQIRRRMHDQTQSSEAYVQKTLNIPESLAVESIIGVGYPAESKPPHGKEALQRDKIHYDIFGKQSI